MDAIKAKEEAARLRQEIQYHNQKYYEQDAPEIEDYEYDRLYRCLEDLEEEYPELITPDSPTQKVGARGMNQFAPVVHTVPLESLQDAFSEEEMADSRRGAGPGLYCGAEVRWAFGCPGIPERRL